MKCKRAGSFRVCAFYDKGNERHVLTVVRLGDMIVEGEAWKFYFNEGRLDRDRTYRGIRGVNDVEHLLHRSCDPSAWRGYGAEECEVERERLEDAT